MALHWKLIIDSARPHALADFWAAALEYVVEDPGLLVAELVRNGDLPEGATVVHAGTPRFAELAAVRHPDDPFDPVSGAGRGPRAQAAVPGGPRAEEREEPAPHRRPRPREIA